MNSLRYILVFFILVALTKIDGFLLGCCCNNGAGGGGNNRRDVIVINTGNTTGTVTVVGRKNTANQQILASEINRKLLVSGKKLSKQMLANLNNKDNSQVKNSKKRTLPNKKTDAGVSTKLEQLS